MCECLEYDSGAMFLCEACAPMWLEWRKAAERRTRPDLDDARLPEDEGHYELGLRISIATALGDLPGEANPAWGAWAQRLLDDALAYRALAPVSSSPPPPAQKPCANGHEWVKRFEGSSGGYVCLRCGEMKR